MPGRPNVPDLFAGLYEALDRQSLASRVRLDAYDAFAAAWTAAHGQPPLPLSDLLLVATSPEQAEQVRAAVTAAVASLSETTHNSIIELCSQAAAAVIGNRTDATAQRLHFDAVIAMWEAVANAIRDKRLSGPQLKPLPAAVCYGNRPEDRQALETLRTKYRRATGLGWDDLPPEWAPQQLRVALTNTLATAVRTGATLLRQRVPNPIAAFVTHAMTHAESVINLSPDARDRWALRRWAADLFAREIDDAYNGGRLFVRTYVFPPPRNSPPNAN